MDQGQPEAIFTEVSSYREGRLFRARVVDLAHRHDFPDLLTFALHHVLLVPSGTYQKSLVEKVGGYRPELWQSEDYDFHIRLAAVLRQPVFLDEGLISIRLRPESRSRKEPEVWRYRLTALQLLQHDLPQMYSGELRRAARRVGSKLYRLGSRADAREAFRFAAADDRTHGIRF